MFAQSCLTHDGAIEHEATRKLRRGLIMMSTITGIIALYIFMLAAFTGYEVIAQGAGHPAHAADVRLELRARHRAGGRDGRARPRDTTLEKVIGFVGVLLAAGNAVGGYVVTERMLEMFKSSGQKEVGAH